MWLAAVVHYRSSREWRSSRFPRNRTALAVATASAVRHRQGCRDPVCEVDRFGTKAVTEPKPGRDAPSSMSGNFGTSSAGSEA